MLLIVWRHRHDIRRKISRNQSVENLYSAAMVNVSLSVKTGHSIMIDDILLLLLLPLQEGRMEGGVVNCYWEEAIIIIDFPVEGR